MLLGEARRPPRGLQRYPIHRAARHLRPRPGRRCGLRSPAGAVRRRGRTDRHPHGLEPDRRRPGRRISPASAFCWSARTHPADRLDRHQRQKPTEDPGSPPNGTSALADIAEYRVAHAIAGPNLYGSVRTMDDDPRPRGRPTRHQRPRRRHPRAHLASRRCPPPRTNDPPPSQRRRRPRC